MQRPKSFFVLSTRGTHTGSDNGSRGRVANQTEASTETPKLVGRLFLHQVEAHGHQRHAADQVERAGDHLLRAVRVKAGSRHVVAEPDGGERDETEVGGDERVPVFGQSEQECSEHDVAGHQQ